MQAIGYDPIWFGVIIVIVWQVGMIAPPVGLNVFVISGMVKDVPHAGIYRGIMPFLVAMIVLFGGIDMTDAQLDKAERLRAAAGFTNVTPCGG